MVDTPSRARVIAMANQKGGVGKTTATVNIGAAIAEMGHRVLIIDLDPQGNASSSLGLTPASLQVSVYDVLLHDVALENCIEATAVRHLFVAPSNLNLAGAEIELVPVMGRETRLRRAIDAVADQYAYVLIDCPPSLGLLTINALTAADEVLVPMQCEYIAVEGMVQLDQNVALVRANLNPRLKISMVLLQMYDARTKLSQDVVDEVRKHKEWGPKTLKTLIPRTVRIAEAPSYGKPVITFDPSSVGAKAYREAAKEVVAWPA